MVYGNGRGGEGEWAFRICPSNDVVGVGRASYSHSGRERGRSAVEDYKKRNAMPLGRNCTAD